MPDYLADALAEMPLMLSADTVADFLNVRVQTVYRWLSEGDLPGYKIRSTWVIPRDGFRDFMKQRANRAAQEDGDVGTPNE